MWKEISMEQWMRETQHGFRVVGGGELLSGGSYSEYAKELNEPATHRYEMKNGLGYWFKFVWSK